MALFLFGVALFVGWYFMGRLISMVSYFGDGFISRVVNCDSVGS